MGHTVYAMRYVVYDKIGQMKKLCHGLREPEKTAALDLLNNVYQNISAITYANPMPDEIENSMLFAMLIEEKRRQEYDVDDLTILIFSLMITRKSKS